MDDLISRQAAIDVLCKLMNSWFGDSKDEQEEIKWIINHLPSAQQWTPCNGNEQPPEENADILVTVGNSEELRIVPVNYAKGTWFDCIFNTELKQSEVLAWMPLPKPYRGGEQDE